LPEQGALKGVTCRLMPDKLNVLVGPNGADRTTLLDCMTGILPASEQMELPPMAQILYLTQELFFSPQLRGRDLAKCLCRLGGLRASNRVEDYQEGLDAREREMLAHLWDLKLGKASTGERRWLFVTLLTRIDRRLYLLDEPTSGVDPTSRLRILGRLQRLVEGGGSCLVSTHHLQDLRHVDAHLICP